MKNCPAEHRAGKTIFDFSIVYLTGSTPKIIIFRAFFFSSIFVDISVNSPLRAFAHNVYHYDAKERIFETAKEHADRMAEKDVEKRPSVLKELKEQKH